MEIINEYINKYNLLVSNDKNTDDKIFYLLNERPRDNFIKLSTKMYQLYKKNKKVIYIDLLYDFLYNYSYFDQGIFNWEMIIKNKIDFYNCNCIKKVFILLAYVNILRLFGKKKFCFKLSKCFGYKDCYKRANLLLYNLCNDNNNNKLMKMYIEYFTCGIKNNVLYNIDEFIRNKYTIVIKENISEHIKIKCANGIGDNIWILVKLSNLKKFTNCKKLTLCMRMNNEMEKRSLELLKKFTFIDEIVNSDHLIDNGYSDVFIGTHCYINNYFDGETMMFLANGFLERGFHLDDIMNIPSNYDFFDYFSSNINDNDIKMKYGANGTIFDKKYTNGYIIVYVAHIHYTLDYDRFWENKYFPNLINEISKISTVPIYLVGAKWDIEMGEKIINSTKNSNIINIIGKTDSIELMHLLKNASLVVGAVSGLTICSVYLKTKTVVLWASNDICINDQGFRFSNNFSINWIPKNYVNSTYLPIFYDKENDETLFYKIKNFFN